MSAFPSIEAYLDPRKGGMEAPGGGPGPLPCLNRNNSTGGAPKYRMSNTSLEGVKQDKSGRIWDQIAPGVYKHLGTAKDLKVGADAKRAFILRQNVKAFIDHYGRSRSLFFTTTDGDNLPPKEYARRWNSLLAHHSEWIKAFIRVLEPQKNMRPHFHNLTAVDFDTKPDAFDWEAYLASSEAYKQKDWQTFRTMRARYVSSAAPELRELWTWGRRVLPAYGLGARFEIVPVRKQGAISEYIGKYLDKGMSIRLDNWKGVRRFETDRRTSKVWKRCGSKFSWFSPGSIAWRARVEQIAFAIGADIETGDLANIRRKLGTRWAYQLRGAILTADQDEWVEILHSLAHRTGAMKSVIDYDNGANAAW